MTLTVPTGLTPEEQAIANEVGAAYTVADPPLVEQMGEAGFTQVIEVDRTAAFLEACEAILRQRAAGRKELVDAEGVEAYDEEVDAKERLRDGIRQGLLTRSLISGRRL